MGEMQLGCIMQFDCNEDCACLGGIVRSDYSLVGNSQNSLPRCCCGGVPLFTNRTRTASFTLCTVDDSIRFTVYISLFFLLLLSMLIYPQICTIGLFALFYLNIYYSNTLELAKLQANGN